MEPVLNAESPRLSGLNPSFPRPAPRALTVELARSPQAVALRFEDRDWTYAQLRDGAHRVARRLQDTGLPAGTRVGAYATNSDAYALLFLACVTAGYVHVPVNFALKGGVIRKTVGYVHAVEDVSFTIGEQETFALVGESGCGKSTTGRSILRLIEPTEGAVRFDGEDLRALDGEAMRKKRRDMQLIFQDPYSSLNPRMTVGQIIGEGMMTHKQFKSNDDRMKQRVLEVMDDCGLAPYFLHRYPHQFSGGQRQRIGIARALSLRPKFVVCDEAVSALDVSIQSQIINLLQNLKEKENLTYLFITHDLAVVKYISDRVAVMYLGVIVELAKTEELFKCPMHPYTEALLAAIPTADENESRELVILEGDIPSPVNAPKGCKFHTRCKYATEICSHVEPPLEEITPNHFVACHHRLETACEAEYLSQQAQQTV